MLMCTCAIDCIDCNVPGKISPRRMYLFHLRWAGFERNGSTPRVSRTLARESRSHVRKWYCVISSRSPRKGAPHSNILRTLSAYFCTMCGAPNCAAPPHFTRRRRCECVSDRSRERKREHAGAALTKSIQLFLLESRNKEAQDAARRRVVNFQFSNSRRYCNQSSEVGTRNSTSSKGREGGRKDDGGTRTSSCAG